MSFSFYLVLYREFLPDNLCYRETSYGKGLFFHVTPHDYRYRDLYSSVGTHATLKPPGGKSNNSDYIQTYKYANIISCLYVCNQPKKNVIFCYVKYDVKKTD